MKRWHMPFAVLVVCLLSFGSIGYLAMQHYGKAAHANDTFTPIDLGAVYTEFNPVGISDSGAVVGNVGGDYRGDEAGKVVIWQAGSTTNLSFPTGSGRADAISPTGEVVGYTNGFYDDSGNLVEGYAVKWDGSVPTDLGGPATCESNWLYTSEATAANDSGDIAGTRCDSPTGKLIAGYWPGGTPNSFTQLPDLSYGIGDGWVSGINHNRHVVGNAFIHTQNFDDTHPVFWKNGTVTDLVSPTDNHYAYANAINNYDLVVGSYDGQPYVWDLSNNQSHNLNYNDGGVGGAAYAVNDSGVVVGSFSQYGAAYDGVHAFMWKVGDSNLTNLNDLLPANSGWELENAVGINSSGQIVGTGMYNGLLHAFVLNTSTITSYRLSLAPASQTATIGGGQGLVTATLLDGATSAPVSNVKLSFRIEAGPNAGMSGTCFPSSCTTDANGQVDWGYLGTAIGVDTVQAWMDTNGNGVPDTGEPQTTAAVTWIWPSSPESSPSWAGYVAQNPPSVRPVSARVTLPNVRCNQAGTVSIWVGYDGTVPGSNTVEQDGINATCPRAGSKVAVAFSLWWELYNGNPPKGMGNGLQNPIKVPVTLVAGDNVYLLVNRITQKSGVDKIYFSIYVEDSAGRSLMKPWQKTVPEPMGFAATYKTAECIAEPPLVGSNGPTRVYSPLPDFGTITFTNCSAIKETASLIRLNMLRNGHLLASTSDISLIANGGDSFSVTWISSS